MSSVLAEVIAILNLSVEARLRFACCTVLYTIGLLTVDPEERMTIDEVAEHGWLIKGRTSDNALVTPTILDSAASMRKFPSATSFVSNAVMYNLHFGRCCFQCYLDCIFDC